MNQSKCGCTTLQNCQIARGLYILAVEAFEQLGCASPYQLRDAERVFNTAKLDFVQHRRAAFKEISNEPR